MAKDSEGDTDQESESDRDIKILSLSEYDRIYSVITPWSKQASFYQKAMRQAMFSHYFAQRMAVTVIVFATGTMGCEYE